MALNISGATYGRDKAGQKRLLANLKNDIEKARKSLTGADYENIIKMVRQYWSGADAEKFLNTFKKSVSEVSTKMKTYEATIEKALSSDANQFAKLQSRNASTITKK